MYYGCRSYIDQYASTYIDGTKGAVMRALTREFVLLLENVFSY